MKRIILTSCVIALAIAGCSQKDEAGSAATAPKAILPAKVTADTYIPPVVLAGDGPVTSINADGNVAPFGWAERKAIEVAAVAAAPAAETAAASSALFGIHCVACHGANGEGVQGLGPNLRESEFVAGKSVAELTAFLKAGRGIDSPDNSTGVPMPGFAWMSDANLAEITGHLKSF